MEFSQSELTELHRAFSELEEYVQRQNYQGYDPYDVLTSKFPFKKLGKWPPIVAIQVFKRNPVNLRKIFGVPKMWNPKGLGLFLQGYASLPKSAENEKKCRWLFEKIMELKTSEVPGLAWGYPFPWASPEKYLPQWSPTAVVSGFIAQALDIYYRKYEDNRVLDAMEQVCVFFTEALFHTQNDKGDYRISYSTAVPDFCYNASLLAAQVYALTYAHNRRQDYYEMARRAADTVVNYQKQDGSWNYSQNIETFKERVQIDFHQGYVIDSLMAISQALDYTSPKLEKAVQKGFEFYAENQFLENGQSKWRLPKIFPADIHHQAQGVLTGLRFYNRYRNPKGLELARRVLNYTLQNFQDKRGYFYYRKHKYFMDRTSYMRWGNAWMFLAMAECIAVVDVSVSRRENVEDKKRVVS